MVCLCLDLQSREMASVQDLLVTVKEESEPGPVVVYSIICVPLDFEEQCLDVSVALGVDVQGQEHIRASLSIVTAWFPGK